VEDGASLENVGLDDGETAEVPGRRGRARPNETNPPLVGLAPPTAKVCGVSSQPPPNASVGQISVGVYTLSFTKPVFIGAAIDLAVPTAAGNTGSW
jgi:hypothetical protein